MLSTDVLPAKIQTPALHETCRPMASWLSDMLWHELELDEFFRVFGHKIHIYVDPKIRFFPRKKKYFVEESRVLEFFRRRLNSYSEGILG